MRPRTSQPSDLDELRPLGERNSGPQRYPIFCTLSTFQNREIRSNSTKGKAELGDLATEMLHENIELCRMWMVLLSLGAKCQYHTVLQSARSTRCYKRPYEIAFQTTTTNHAKRQVVVASKIAQLSSPARPWTIIASPIQRCDANVIYLHCGCRTHGAAVAWARTVIKGNQQGRILLRTVAIIEQGPKSIPLVCLATYMSSPLGICSQASRYIVVGLPLHSLRRRRQWLRSNRWRLLYSSCNSGLL